MAGDATKVEMNVCNVSFDGEDLGYTSGYVKLTYEMSTIEKKVDQEDAPIDEKVTAQNLTVTVPLAERSWARLANFFPDAVYTADGTKEKIVLSGSAGTSLMDMAKELVLNPVDSNDTVNDKVTLKYAAPMPKIDITYDKENVRVYNVTFKALKGAQGFVVFGDESASAAVTINTVEPTTGAAAGGEAFLIRGFGFTGTTGATGVQFDGTNAAKYVVLDDRRILAVSPVVSAGSTDVKVTNGTNDTLTGAITMS